MSGIKVDQLINAASELLRKAGVDQPRREARLLLQDMMGWSATDFISAETDAIPDIRADAFIQNVRTRAQRIPLAHVTGVVSFCGLELLSDARALVPRDDSETLVREALKRLGHGRDPRQVVDLGTGSGCLLLAVLSEARRARGTGYDLSPEAITLAQENAERTRLSDRASFIAADWLTADLTQADLVISNPPYIASDVIETLDPEVRDHDPTLALDGGADGLDAYRQIVPLARETMKPGAWLMVEIGYDQGEAVSTLLTLAGFEEVDLIRDLGGRDRVVIGKQAA